MFLSVAFLTEGGPDCLQYSLSGLTKPGQICVNFSESGAVQNIKHESSLFDDYHVQYKNVYSILMSFLRSTS